MVEHTRLFVRLGHADVRWTAHSRRLWIFGNTARDGVFNEDGGRRLIDRRTLIAGLSAALVAPRCAFAQTIRDAAGRAVKIPAKVSRVFPAGPPASILLYTLAPDLLIGWARANRPEECAYMLPYICTRPEVGRITGRGNTANLETVLALKPDLILDVGSTSATFVSLADRVQEQTSIPYALLDGRFASIAATYRTLGTLIGRADDAEKLARYAEETLKTILGRIELVAASDRPKVYYARGPRGLSTGLGGSINVETIEMLGRNVAGETQGGLANVSIEQVLVWNPDVIITIDQEFAATVRNDRSWAAVKAVRDNRIHLSPKMPFGWVDFPPSVNRLIGLWWLAKILYPERFPEDLRTLTAEFYTRFYHVTPSPAQIDHVLAGRD
jgi:iron complex transport system substrate-binding protein